MPTVLTSIGAHAFNGCRSLKSIELPVGVTSIGISAIAYCKSLENITFSGTREQWEKIKKAIYWNNGTPAKVVHCSDGDMEIYKYFS